MLAEWARAIDRNYTTQVVTENCCCPTTSKHAAAAVACVEPAVVHSLPWVVTEAGTGKGTEEQAVGL